MRTLRAEHHRLGAERLARRRADGRRLDPRAQRLAQQVPQLVAGQLRHRHADARGEPARGPDHPHFGIAEDHEVSGRVERRHELPLRAHRLVEQQHGFHRGGELMAQRRGGLEHLGLVARLDVDALELEHSERAPVALQRDEQVGRCVGGTGVGPELRRAMPERRGGAGERIDCGHPGGLGAVSALTGRRQHEFPRMAIVQPCSGALGDEQAGRGPAHAGQRPVQIRPRSRLPAKRRHDGVNVAPQVGGTLQTRPTEREHECVRHRQHAFSVGLTSGGRRCEPDEDHAVRTARADERHDQARRRRQQLTDARTRGEVDGHDVAE